MKAHVLLLLGIFFLLFSCRRYPKNNANYTETLTYSDDGSTYQRAWLMSNEKEAFSASHLTNPEEEISGMERLYYMDLVFSQEPNSRKFWAFSYDKLEGMFNGKFTKQRSYSYEGESYIKKAHLNFKGTFEETVVYYDTSGVQPNDTVSRTGSFVLEYQGKNKPIN